MHASEAFLNGAGEAKRAGEANLDLLNTLLGSIASSSERGGQGGQPDDGKDKASPPDGFQNDPPDPSNPNEVREQHLEKVNKLKES